MRTLSRVSERAVLVLGWAAVALQACGTRATREGFVEPSTGRPYAVIARRDHDRTRPSRVLFALHAHATEPNVLVERYRLVARAVGARDWLLVVPEGQRDGVGNRYWNASAACCGLSDSKPDDVAYLRAVLADVRTRYAVAADQVAAIGVSNGGFMAHRWACEPGGDLRVIVSVAGAGPGPDDAPCRPSVPVSVLQIHGDRDDTIRYQGGRAGHGRYPSAAETVRAWLRTAGTAVEPRRSRRRSPFLSVIRREDYALAAQRLSLWTFEGGEHRLPLVGMMIDEILDFIAPHGRG